MKKIRSKCFEILHIWNVFILLSWLLFSAGYRIFTSLEVIGLILSQCLSLVRVHFHPSTGIWWDLFILKSCFSVQKPFLEGFLISFWNSCYQNVRSPVLVLWFSFYCSLNFQLCLPALPSRNLTYSSVP